MARKIVVNDSYVGEFYAAIAIESTVISLLKVDTTDVTSQFVTDPLTAVPIGATICNDTTGGNYFTEIQVTGTVNLIIL